MKREPKSPEETLAMSVVRKRDSDGHLKVEVRLCTIGNTGGNRYPYGPERCDGLFIRGLGYMDYWSDYEGGHLMIDQLSYYEPATSLRAALLKELENTIRKVERRLDKVRETLGYARTADEQVAQLALALGIMTVFTYDNKKGSDWLCSDVVNARIEINAWVEEEKGQRELRRKAGEGM